MGKGFICIKAILKYRHGSFPQSKLSRELAPASRNHEVPWLYQCGAKSRVFEKAVDFRAKKFTQRHPHPSIRMGANGA